MDFGSVRSVKLTFKGDKKSHKNKNKKKEKRKRSHGDEGAEDEPSSSSGVNGWKVARQISDLRGCVAIRWSDGRFVGARNSGAVELWASEDAPAPEPAQMFTILRASDTQLAIKTGYGKFISPDGTDCKLHAVTEAVGPLEQWQTVFEDGKAALLSGAKNNFVTACRGELFASVGSVKGDNETCEFLYEASDSGDHEAAKKSKITDPRKFARRAGLSKDRIRELEAKGESLYEAILDHRAKEKSDKFCK